MAQHFKINKSQRKLLALCLCMCCIPNSLATSKVIMFKTVNELQSTTNGSVSDVLFHWEDYSMLAAMLVTSCMIGIYYGHFGEKQITAEDFLLAGSTISTLPMALSLTASFITAIELLGNPAEMYKFGVQFWMICCAFLIVVPIASQLYLPVFMKLRLTSCYEYLEMRFCKSVRLYAGGLYFLQMLMYTAVCVYAPALALSDVTGLNVYLAVSVVYFVCIFYGSLGGMKAVIMTDIFQSIVLLASLLTVLVMATGQVGGLGPVWDYAWKSDRLHFFDMNPDPTVRHSFWSVVIGGSLYWLSMFCANQASVQKYMSVRNMQQVRTALWVSAFGLIVIYTINFITGAVLALHYADCDPLKAGVITASDRLLPLYVVEQLDSAHGVPGLFVAGIFAASLGTVAAELNSLAAIVSQDLVEGLFGIKLSEDKEALIARCVSIACGVISFGLVFLVERLGPVLQLTLSFNGMAGGIALGLFSLGMFFPWANARGAVAGAIFGLLLILVVGIGAEFSPLTTHTLPTSVNGCVELYNMTSQVNLEPTDYKDDAVFWLFRVSYLWYTGIGCAATILVGLLVSIITGMTDPSTVPVDFLSPPVVKLFHRFPTKSKPGYIPLD